jgi:hypothetical protein
VTGQWIRFVTADRGMRVRGMVRESHPGQVPRRIVRMLAMPETLRVPEDTASSHNSR